MRTILHSIVHDAVFPIRAVKKWRPITGRHIRQSRDAWNLHIYSFPLGLGTVVAVGAGVSVGAGSRLAR